VPTFRYVARTMEGESSTGTISAPALREALEQLRAQDLFVISIREHGRGCSAGKPLWISSLPALGRRSRRTATSWFSAASSPPCFRRE